MNTFCLILHVYIYLYACVCHKIGNLDFAKQQDFKSNLGLVSYTDGHFIIIDTHTEENKCEKLILLFTLKQIYMSLPVGKQQNCFFMALRNKAILSATTVIFIAVR